MNPVIGIDFDNTIINYDDVLFRLAVRAGFIAPNTRKSKKFIRDTIRTLPNGEIEWQKIQAVMYGPAIGEAVLNDGVADFIRACRDRRLPVFIVSHKTPFSNLLGPSAVNFRDAARAWMIQHGFFRSNGLGLTQDQVFFEATRQAKVARIAALGCTHFIDDLEETFLEPDFPSGVARILYNPHGEEVTAQDVQNCIDWRQIGTRVLATRTSNEEADTVRAAAALLNRPVDGITRIGGGRNSRVYRVDTAGGQRYALKRYFRNSHDSRDRRATEFTALQFLQRHGVRTVPEPLASDAALNASVFSFIEGSVANVVDATAADMDRLADFLHTLRGLSEQPDAARLPIASEAMFSLHAVVENIDGRLQRFRAVQGKEETYTLLTHFLENEFRPTFAQTVAWAELPLREHGLSRDQELDTTARTLSPSDFGFHNAPAHARTAASSSSISSISAGMTPPRWSATLCCTPVWILVRIYAVVS